MGGGGGGGSRGVGWGGGGLQGGGGGEGMGNIHVIVKQIMKCFGSNFSRYLPST